LKRSPRTRSDSDNPSKEIGGPKGKAAFTHICQLCFNHFDPSSHNRICQQGLKLRRRACLGGFALEITHVLSVLRENEVFL